MDCQCDKVIPSPSSAGFEQMRGFMKLSDILPVEQWIELENEIYEKDYEITNRLESLADKNDPGLIGTGKIKRYVKTWQTIIDEFKISSSYLLTHLKTQRDNLENETAASLTLSLQQKTA